METYLNPQYLLSSVVYSAIGIVIYVVAYKVMERVLPFNVAKELHEDQNTAVGVLLGAMMLGLAIIIASAIHG
jgi:putative membrane protein